jgi:hypothetical protein
MKLLVAIVGGLLSGLMIYMAAAVLLVWPGQPGPAFVFITFLGGAAASGWLLTRGAKSVSRVFSRAFLLGAAEWLGMIPIGIAMGAKAASATAGAASSGPEAAGAAIGGGLFAVMSSGVALFMAIVCLVGFTISFFLGREMADRTATPTRKCPFCAEMIQQEAIKCKHCGASVSVDAVQGTKSGEATTTA